MGLSLIVTLRNAEKSLPGFISAALEQPFRDMEILLVDRGSVDGTAMLCRGYEAAYPELIRVLRLGTARIGEARNLAIDRARGEYLIFADCSCLPDRKGLAALAERIENDGADLYLLNGGAGERFSLTERPQTLLEPVDIRQTVWKRQLFDDAYLRFPEKPGRDALRLACKALALSRSIETVPEQIWQELPEPEPVREGEYALMDALDDICSYYRRRGLTDFYGPWLTRLAMQEVCDLTFWVISQRQDRACLAEYIRYLDNRFPEWKSEGESRWRGLDARKVLELVRQERWQNLKMRFALRKR